MTVGEWIRLASQPSRCQPNGRTLVWSAWDPRLSQSIGFTFRTRTRITLARQPRSVHFAARHTHTLLSQPAEFESFDAWLRESQSERETARDTKKSACSSCSVPYRARHYGSEFIQTLVRDVALATVRGVRRVAPPNLG